MKDVTLSYDSPKYQYIFIEVINMYFAYVRTKLNIHVFIVYLLVIFHIQSKMKFQW